jgi:hypothetical protein
MSAYSFIQSSIIVNLASGVQEEMLYSSSCFVTPRWIALPKGVTMINVDASIRNKLNKASVLECVDLEDELCGACFLNFKKNCISKKSKKKSRV